MDVQTLKSEKSEFYRQICTVAIPVMLQQLIIVAVGLCDTIMVGKLSEQALAAVGAANQVFTVYMDTIFGFLSGIGVYAVQYWGIRDLKALRKLLGFGYAVVIAIGIPATAFVYGLAPRLISIFSRDPLVISEGTAYLRIQVFTFIIGALTFVISYNSRVISRLVLPTIANATAVCLNIFLNWCLIFGNLGFEAMGVRGAATATLISRIVEFIFMVLTVYLAKDHPLKAKLSELKFNGTLMKNAAKTAAPVALNELLWVLSFTSMYAIYGMISTSALAVSQVAMIVTNVCQSLYIGLGNGCTVVIGQTLGRGDRELAYTYAKRCINITWLLNIVLTVGLILLRGAIVSIYDFSDETNELLMQTLLVYALALSPKMLAYLTICGILRPGGDTIWTAVLDAGMNWLVGIPLALVSVLVFKLNLPLCVAVSTIAEILKTIFSLKRVYSKKWINVFTGK